jgi:rSAM/selenodomain-associated transferase 1
MPKQLLIVFVKNLTLGKVKTRLAKTIGNDNAFKIYEKLVSITEQVTSTVEFEKHIYFSNEVITTKWHNEEKLVQTGQDIGERMLNAFKDGFDKGYEQIILIGSDLPEISEEIITKGFEALKQSELVFGPAQDGGYYLIGMNKLSPTLFQNKPWSQPNLLQTTLSETNDYSLLKELNDIDTIEDLRNSFLNNQFKF